LHRAVEGESGAAVKAVPVEPNEGC
jgi:hypothetical protein